MSVTIDHIDISYAEKILLKPGDTFDHQRRDFIQNMGTLDVQAVPGSGKTTALLAKLLILEKKLPLDNDRGILVLSHTNAAIDEIKEKIGPYCPKLFAYPNFIGTIQSFVDQFLAIPYYSNSLKNKPYRIDNEIYDERVLAYTLPQGPKNWVNNRLKPEEFKKSIRFNKNFDLISGLNGNEADFPLKNKASATYKSLKKMKVDLLKQGILHFDDAYTLGSRALIDFPLIKILIQKRFQFVFVDEMQDMEQHQYDILETLFFDDGNSLSSFQRIGDLNQAIYSGKVGLDKIWQDRALKLPINGSHRLTPAVAEVVDCFALHREPGINITGMRTGAIKPHLIVYQLGHIDQVVPAFSQMVLELLTDGRIETNEKNRYKIIGWIKEQEQNKIRLNSYCNSYKTENNKSKIDYPTLDCYLKLFDTEKRTLESVRKGILNALIKALRLEHIINPDDQRPYSKKQLIKYLSYAHPEEIEDFSVKIYQWSIGLIRGQFTEVHDQIKAYIPILLSFFKKAVNHSAAFVNDIEPNIGAYDITVNKNENKVNLHGFDIEVTTIHSAKGQTHTATLYVETFYERGNGNYESERLSNQFLFTNLNSGIAGNIIKQSAKMAYVGLSRPTHLLCVAIQKERFDAKLAAIDRTKWEVIEI
jgi:DNA helicase-2/ATP-dependent DNA helicase PcrA